MTTTHRAPHSISGPITPTDALAFWHTLRSAGISTLSPRLLALSIVGLCKENTLCATCGGEIDTGLRTDDPGEALEAAARIEDGAIVCPMCGKAYPIELGSLISEEEAELLGLPIHIDGGGDEHIDLSIELRAFRQRSEAEIPGSTERPASRRQR
jgi:uncharacterized protein YbaR (Trm112 family)